MDAENAKLDSKKTIEVSKTVKYRDMYLPESPNQMYNGVKLETLSSFGLYGKAIYNNMSFLGEDNYVFPVGKHILIFDSLSRKSSFIARDLAATDVTALTTSLTKKREHLVAVSERFLFDSPPVVTIYNTGKSKAFKLVHHHISHKNEITQIVLPDHGKNCFTLATGANFVVSVWLFEKEKLMINYEIKLMHGQINKMAVHPKDHTKLTVCGHNYLRLFDIHQNEKYMKEVPGFVPRKTEKENNFVDITWVPNSSILLVVSQQNTLLIFDHFELRHEIPINFSIRDSKRESDMALRATPGEEERMKENEYDLGDIQFDDSELQGNKAGGYDVSPRESSISQVATCLSAHRKGFVIGFTGGLIGIYEFENGSAYVPTHLGNFKVADNVERVHNLAISSDDITLGLVARCSSRSLSKLRAEFVTQSVGSPRYLAEYLQYYLLNIIQIDNTKMSSPFVPIFPKGIPWGGISDLAVCKSKPLIGLVGNDKTIRLLSYNQHEFAGQLSYTTQDLPICLSIHPFGVQIAVGFASGFRVYYVLEDDLKLAWETTPKTCHSVAYSNGGHYIAAGNGIAISVYNPSTFENIFNITGHTGIIRCLRWVNNDRLLLSACGNGFIFGWKTSWWDPSTLEDKIVSHSTKNVKINAIAYDEDLGLVVASSSDQKLKVLSDHGAEIDVEMQIPDCQYTALCLSRQLEVLFVGTSLGTVRVYLWPMVYPPNGNLLQQYEYGISQAGISKIEISQDGLSLFISADNGVVISLSIKEIIEGVEQSQESTMTKFSKRGRPGSANKAQENISDTLCLVSKTVLDSKKKQIAELEYKVQNIQSSLHSEIQKSVTGFEEQIGNIEKMSQDLIEKEHVNQERAQADFEEEKKVITASMDDEEEEHLKRREELDIYIQDKLQQEHERRDQMADELERIKMDYKTELDTILGSHHDSIQSIEEEYKKKYESLLSKHTDTLGKMKSESEKYDVAVEQHEFTYEKEIKDMTQNFENAIKTEKENSDVYQEKFKTQKESNEELNKKFNEVKDINKKLEEDHRALLALVEELRDNLQKKNEQLDERDDIIDAKEHSIRDLKSKNVHLKNFRFVLNHKINSLKDEKVPMQEELNNLQEDFKKMYAELVQEGANERKMEEELQRKGSILRCLRNQIQEKEAQSSFLEQKLVAFQYEIAALFKNQNVKNIPFKLRDIYEKHIAEFDREQGGMIDLEAEKEKGKSKNAKENVEQGVYTTIQNDLLRQRDWINKKAFSMNDQNQKMKRESSEAITRVQTENTQLLKEYNELMKENRDMKDKLSLLKTELQDLKFLQKKEVEDRMMTDSRRMTRESDARANRLRGSQSEATLSQVKTKSSRHRNKFKDLLGELDRNKEEIAQQTQDIQKLQNQVYNFLSTQDKPENVDKKDDQGDSVHEEVKEGESDHLTSTFTDENMRRFQTEDEASFLPAIGEKHISKK